MKNFKTESRFIENVFFNMNGQIGFDSKFLVQSPVVFKKHV